MMRFIGLRSYATSTGSALKYGSYASLPSTFHSGISIGLELPVFGARSQLAHEKGLAHLYKNMAFKSNEMTSQMSLVRNFESLGLNSTTQYGKESLTLMIHLGQSSSLPSADLQPIVRYAVSLLAASLTNIEHYQGHEWQKEAVPLTLLESKSSASDPAVKALEALHSVLFPRSGLANALHCQDWKSYSMADLVAYKKRALSSQKATHDTGPASTLYKLWTFGLADDQTAHLTESLVEPLVRSMMQSLPAAAPKESRQERKGTESPSSLPSHASKESWIEGPSADYQASMAWRTPFTSPAELVALWTLQAHLAKGVSRLAATENKHAHHLSTTHPISLQYRDTGVLGYRLSGFATEDKAVEAGRALYAALRSALSKPSAASLEQDLPALKSMVKSNLLDHLSHRISAIPMYSLLQESQLESIFSLVDRVKVENVTKMMKELAKEEPATVMHGPYLSGHSILY